MLGSKLKGGGRWAVVGGKGTSQVELSYVKGLFWKSHITLQCTCYLSDSSYRSIPTARESGKHKLWLDVW